MSASDLPHQHERERAGADVLNLMRAVACLRPGVLKIPRDEDGRPVFRLADLAAANGFASGGAHDAMRDVELTLQLCHRVREGAPDIWSNFMRFASKTVGGRLYPSMSRCSAISRISGGTREREALHLHRHQSLVDRI